VNPLANAPVGLEYKSHQGHNLGSVAFAHSKSLTHHQQMKNLNKLALILLLLVCGCGPSDSASTASTSGETETDKPKVDVPEVNWEKGKTGVANAPKTGEFTVKFETTAGDFTTLVHREWAPMGAERFYQLIESKFFDGAPFYRVVPGFIVQFGMNGDPKGTQYWDKSFGDDPVKQTNRRATMTFAMAGPGTRSTQLFINFGNNRSLDSQGFSPFGEVTEGMEMVDAINAEYAQKPNQGLMHQHGNEYVFSSFPNIDYIKKAYFVDATGDDEAADEETKKETTENDASKTDADKAKGGGEGEAAADGGEGASDQNSQDGGNLKLEGPK
jgi:peptidyl-prolyl cis-trans isomerase A (cyclophilin A)